MDVDTGVKRKLTLPLIDDDDQVAGVQSDFEPAALRGRLYRVTVAKLKSITPPLTHSLRRPETSLLRLVLVYNIFRSLEATTADGNISFSASVAEPDRRRPTPLFHLLLEEDERDVLLLPGPNPELHGTIELCSETQETTTWETNRRPIPTPNQSLERTCWTPSHERPSRTDFPS
jgi:hypothetical protein